MEDCQVPEGLVNLIRHQMKSDLVVPVAPFETVRLKPHPGVSIQHTGVTVTTWMNSFNMFMMGIDVISKVGFFGEDSEDEQVLEFGKYCMTMKLSQRFWTYKPFMEEDFQFDLHFCEDAMPHYVGTFLKSAFGRTGFHPGMVINTTRLPSFMTRLSTATPPSRIVSSRRVKVKDPDAAAVLYLWCMADVYRRQNRDWFCDAFWDAVCPLVADDPLRNLRQIMASLGYDKFTEPRQLTRTQEFLLQRTYVESTLIEPELPEVATRDWTLSFLKRRYGLEEDDVLGFLDALKMAVGRVVIHHHLLTRLYDVDYA
jgi:hypothetical protein